MSARGRIHRSLAGALMILSLPAYAAAQAASVPRDAVKASVTATTVYDDNVLGRPDATADEILRVTPSFSLTIGRPRFGMTGALSFDAERYQMHQDLTTAQARRSGSFSGLFLTGPHTTLSWDAGQSSTTNPAELNTLTALSIGRQQATRSHGASALRQVLGPHSAFDLGYDFSRDQLSGGSITTTHSLDMRLSHQATKRTDLYVRVNSRHFDFGASGAAAVLSNLANAGWTAHGKTAHFTAEAGVQRTGTAYGSTVDLNAGRTFGKTDISGGYGRGVTTAIGVAGAIIVDHVQASAVYQGQPTVQGAAGQGTNGLRISVRFGGSRNQLPTSSSTSLQWSADIAKPLSRMLWVQAGYDGSTQQGLIGAIGPAGGDIRRNRVTFTLSFIPWSPR